MTIKGYHFAYIHYIYISYTVDRSKRAYCFPFSFHIFLSLVFFLFVLIPLLFFGFLCLIDPDRELINDNPIYRAYNDEQSGLNHDSGGGGRSDIQGDIYTSYYGRKYRTKGK